MKKILVLFSIALVLITGCSTNMNTPTAKVEEFLSKYQTMDNEVLEQLKTVIKSDKTMSEEQKLEYRGLMEKQYQNLSYKIKNEKIDGDTAVVDVEIEVYDYATSIKKSQDYYMEHKDEFLDDENKNNDSDSGEIIGGAVEDASEAIEDMFTETSKFIDYKIKQLKDVTDKAKYDITFHLNKNEENEWVLEDISDADRQKLHGLYEG